MMNMSCFSDAQFEHPDWKQFQNLADFVIITNPSVPKTF
jgi:hypothetical protein